MENAIWLHPSKSLSADFTFIPDITLQVGKLRLKDSKQFAQVWDYGSKADLA